MLSKVYCTFHGRDIFAPAAAHLDIGVRSSEFGPEIKDPVQPAFTKIEKEADSVIGEVLYIDGFGNIITNMTPKDLANNAIETINVQLPQASLKLKFAKTYAEAKQQQPITLVGGHGFLEIALNQGDAAKKFNVKVGEKIVVTAF